MRMHTTTTWDCTESVCPPQAGAYALALRTFEFDVEALWLPSLRRLRSGRSYDHCGVDVMEGRLACYAIALIRILFSACGQCYMGEEDDTDLRAKCLFNLFGNSFNEYVSFCLRRAAQARAFWR